MNPWEIITGAFTWLNDPLNWTGDRGLFSLTLEHLAMTALAVCVAAIIAIPLGVFLARIGKGGAAVVVIANITRAIPTLALLTLFATTAIGFGNPATVLAVAVFALPPILINVHTGIRQVDPAAKEAAVAMGMTTTARLWGVEVPMALPLIAAGVRTSAVQAVATVPLAALVGGGGLGVVITQGFATRHFDEALAGAIVVVVLCFVVELLLAGLQWVATPKPMRGYSSSRIRRTTQEAL